MCRRADRSYKSEGKKGRGIKMPDVCIVSMPYDLLHMPSIGIGQLVAAARGRAIDARAVYAKFWFAEKIGLKNYNIICHLLNPASLLAEWTFSKAAFPGFHAPDDEYLAMAAAAFHEEVFINIILDKFSEHNNIGEFLLEMRKEAGDFIMEAAERILAMKPVIVGCSSMFQQQCASLALLRRLK
jgi:magnesium-protoporphyrin IX monomethyl ester (oxidative) cyclase